MLYRNQLTNHTSQPANQPASQPANQPTSQPPTTPATTHPAHLVTSAAQGGGNVSLEQNGKK